ncbi:MULTISPECIES: hypothetical protein [Streptomyces]|uniref:hypothetical protein n=1 Tax=Streptomyces TaxID=1883 RepID=UPI00345BC48C
MSDEVTTAQRRPSRIELGRYLTEVGALRPEWKAAFEALPREWFLPDLMWAYDMASGTSEAVSRSSDPTAWESTADANVPLVTQWDDGHHTGTAPGTEATSSSSMPTLVFDMLHDLDVHPGHKILEIVLRPAAAGGEVLSRLWLPVRGTCVKNTDAYL